MRGRLSRGSHLDTGSAQAPGRRQFLRRAGITAALTAAVVGGADLAGLTAASAKVRPSSRKRSPDTCCVTAVYSPFQCRPDGAACPSGECCFHLLYSGCSGETDHFACLGGVGCKTFSECA